MKKTLCFLTLFCGLLISSSSFAIVPAKPGVPVPQIIIDKIQQEGDRFYPTPALVNTMARYAEAKRLGLDDAEDVSGYFPVVCGKYADSGPDDWPIEEIQQELFDGPWPTGTMAEYYEEVSFNQFHLDGNSYGWYTSTLTQAYVVGTGYGMGPDAHLGEFLSEILYFADPEVDFAEYDNDGPDGIANSGDDDGFVDTIFFIHDGAGGETGAQNIWSHSYNMYWLLGGNYYITNDTSANGGFVKIGPYIIQPSINSSGGIIEIGVFCHEFGHALGLPDLYDTDYSSEGVGVWCLMGSGNWNTPAKPAHLSTWCRYKMGWVEPTIITSWLHNQFITYIENTGNTYRLWNNGAGGNQYFMVENRQRYGFDVNLKGEGLLIWHIDESAQQQNEEHPKVDLEQADGMDDLNNNINSGDPGDPFPGSYDNHWFDEYTNPNSLNYMNQPTQVAVWDISEEADTMSANLDVVYSQPWFELIGNAIEDSSGGDDDGRADPGETVELWITIYNLWATAQNLMGFLSTEADYITIIDNSGAFGNVNSHTNGSNQASPFQFAVESDAPEGEWATFSVHLTTPGGFSQDLSFELLIGRPPVLLVDDDLGEDYEQFIASSLEQIGTLYEIWDVNQIGAPLVQTMEYDAVIWMTGDDSTSTLTNADMDYLQQYLDNGGTLILTGQNINEDIGTSSFFSNYLYCAPNSNTVNTVTIAGAPGNPLTGAMNLLIIGTYGAYNQTSPSSVIPQGIAQSSFIYPNGQIAGINYYNANSGAHLVYLAFGLEAVSGLGGTTSRAQFLSAVFNWAGIPAEVNPPDFIAPLPNLFSIESIYPNPFNNTTTIKFSLQNDSEITINIFDLTGREVTVLGEGKFDSGSHLITWNAENLASGIYFINFQGNNINLTRKLLLLK